MDNAADILLRCSVGYCTLESFVVTIFTDEYVVKYYDM